MRCKNCDYRLWNLTSRRCPECGVAFKPGDFELVPNSVRFCCPHCNQDYYGTGEKGHLVPTAFDCVRCGAAIHMDEMVLLPTEGVDEEQTGVEHLPWLQRKERGFVRAWFSMLLRGMGGPGRMMRTVPVTSSVGQAWWFAIFTAMVIALIGAGPFFVFVLLAGGLAGSVPGGLAFAAAFGGAGCVTLLAGLVGLLLWGLATHGLLRLGGRTSCTIGRTYQALCYSCGPSILGAVPCVGPQLFFMIGVGWWVVSAVLAVKEAQGVGGGRAAFAVLPPPLMAAAAVVGTIIYSAMTGPGPMAFAAAGAISQTQSVLSGITSYADQDAGRGPDHAIQLVTDTFMTTSLFVAPGSATSEGNVPVADMTLLRFSQLPPDREQKTAQAAVDALPTNVIAHRLGDFVFTHHGIDMRTADPGLWLVILSYDPDSNPTGATPTGPFGPNVRVTTIPPPQSTGVTAVGRADGTVKAVQPGSLARRLKKQNKLRAKYNLPPLPDPSTVTHDKPAVSSRPPGRSRNR